MSKVETLFGDDVYFDDKKKEFIWTKLDECLQNRTKDIIEMLKTNTVVDFQKGSYIQCKVINKIEQLYDIKAKTP